jgi:hypothetical protein
VHLDKTLSVPEYLVHRIDGGGQHLYFGVGDANEFLQQRDVVGLPEVRRTSTTKIYAEVMHSQKLTGAEILNKSESLKYEVQQQLGRELAANESTNVLQLRRVYDFELEPR